jgi:Cysteine-rich CWC
MPRPLTCEACGAPFACRVAEGDCWCTDVPLGSGGRAAIAAAGHRDCLCPDCLAAAAASARRSPAPTDEERARLPGQ